MKYYEPFILIKINIVNQIREDINGSLFSINALDNIPSQVRNDKKSDENVLN